LQATFLAPGPVYVRPRYGKRGRPTRATPPDQVVYPIDGALAFALTSRQVLIDQHSGFILATNELDDTHLPPQELLEGYKGQVHAGRGFRFLKAPQFLASALYLKKSERIMALLMVMTVCLLVYAALARLYPFWTTNAQHGKLYDLSDNRWSSMLLVPGEFASFLTTFAPLFTKRV